MLSFRAHAIICAILFALLLGIPIAGNIAQASGMAPPAAAPLLAFQIFYFTLFLAFGLSAIPVIVMVVLRQQEGVDRRADRARWFATRPRSSGRCGS